MTAGTAPPAPATTAPARPRRRRRWLRWTIISLLALVVLIVGLVAVAVKTQPVPAPLALPANAGAPAGPVDGSYRVAPGSVAGFRIRQTVIGLTSDVTGRTDDISGTVTVAGGRAGTARLRIGLLALTSGAATGDAKPAPQFATSLDTGRYPDANVALTQPVTLDAAFATGTTATVDAAGTLTLHGITRPVTVALSLRRDVTGVDVAGSFPVAFADYGIAGPEGYGALGSLADHGVAEFLLVLRHT